VLISVGYSTCLWCHVMEEESFEDEEIARTLNENYIAIKVDREERPDVDAIYMSAVQAMTGGGGWPMTVRLTPDRKPYFGGTYFPARDGDRGAKTGFLTLLKRLKEAYRQEPDKVAASSNQLVKAIHENLSPEETGNRIPDAQVFHDVVSVYKNRFDEKDGGLNTAPKFPSQTPIRFLLRYYRRTGDQKILEIATTTLTKMASGGIYDHVGGGFHRYATDKHWLVPHFEKMLYDNALLTMAYLEAYQVTGDAEYERIVREILRYVERDMTSPEGAFYSATDADSPIPSGRREEGYFFTWTEDELKKVLGTERMKVWSAYFILKKEGNFEGRTILHTHTTVSQVVKQLKLSEDKVRTLLTESKDLLYKERSKRPPPIRDEKILTSWNGLMISAHAQAGLILNDPRYTERAVKAADFIFDKLYKEGRLLRSYKDNHAKYNAYLDDYAFLTAGLLDVYEATQNPDWLKKAIGLDQVLAKYYEDKKNGGFFMTSLEHEKLLAREKPNYDGAEPSGNSIALLNLYRLNEFTTDDNYRKRADKALKGFAGRIESNPTALSEMLLALDFRLDKPKEIIIVTPEGQPDDADPLMGVFRRHFLPNRIFSVVAEGKELEDLAELVPLVREKSAWGDRSTAFVCEQGFCALPTADPNVFADQIKKVEKLRASPQ
ncbi:MAG: thioredoxin domain-containing protein, partial [Deltaproteobacteria bacterium]|nr:thioredoxin domain-containing protein [Deltaproteobacteria bacterium]